MHKLRNLLLLLLLTAGMILPVKAEEWQNPDNGYTITLEDHADLFSESEEAEILASMKPLTEWGSALCLTISENSTATARYAEQEFHHRYGSGSATMFLIDMDNRMIYIFSDGRMYEVITENKAEIITDNIYRLASDGLYKDCAIKAFEQETSLMRGERIAQPMKYISNILLSLILGMLICFLAISRFSGIREAESKEILAYMNRRFHADKPSVQKTTTTKHYDPIDLGPSGGGGGGSSGGGGGGSSGGGGGHTF